MRRSQHVFSRVSVVYDCHARQAPADGPNVARSIWRVTVNGREYAAMPYTGNEFDSLQTRTAFEDAIVRAVLRAESLLPSRPADTDMRPM